MAEHQEAQSHTLLTHVLGLHARPAVRVAQLAARFRAEIFIRINDQGEWLSARSAAQIMRLQARVNSVVCFRAVGDDARQAVVEMVSLVDRDFEDLPEGEWTVPAVVAAPGLATGSLWILPPPVVTEDVDPSSSPRAQCQRLTVAIGYARGELQALCEAHDEIAQKILDFQLSLLADEAFLESVWERLEAGDSALNAWREHLEAEMMVYRDSADEYLRARVLDLVDLQQRVSAHLGSPLPSSSDSGEGNILLADDLPPSRFLALAANRLRALILTQGSRISHVATLARHRAIPMLVSPRLDLRQLKADTEVVVDAEAGQLIINPKAATLGRFSKTLAVQAMESAVSEQFLADPVCLGDGEAVRVYLDVDELAALDGLNPAYCDGIGRVRSEALFGASHSLPDEMIQYRRYRRLLDWAEGRPVSIALADILVGAAQADQQPPGGVNLGVRGVRRLLREPGLFAAQLRALCRVAAEGQVQVLLPMISLPAELQQVRQCFADALAELEAGECPGVLPPLGLLLSVPIVLLGLKRFDSQQVTVDLDALLQHLLAVDGTCAELDSLLDPGHPVVVALLHRLVEQCAERGVSLAVCGERIIRPDTLALLLKSGVRSLVVKPGQLARVKAGLAAF